jgi:predicted GIY-YIG superfamily endonuclease
MSVPTPTLGNVEYLCRLYGADDSLLYTGISDDWTRRLRQHWQDKPWADEIITVFLEIYADRRAVRAAEREAIQSEHPLYNFQHNRRVPEPDEPTPALTAADIVAAALIVIVVGYMIYELSQAAIAKYRTWKAERDEFREWQRIRHTG